MLKVLVRLGIVILLILVGGGMIFSTTPMPGVSRGTTLIIGVILIAIGVAIWEISVKRGKTIVEAETWKKVMER
jgi:hypothetical protein